MAFQDFLRNLSRKNKINRTGDYDTMRSEPLKDNLSQRQAYSFYRHFQSPNLASRIVTMLEAMSFEDQEVSTTRETQPCWDRGANISNIPRPSSTDTVVHSRDRRDSWKTDPRDFRNYLAHDEAIVDDAAYEGHASEGEVADHFDANNNISLGHQEHCDDIDPFDGNYQSMRSVSEHDRLAEAQYLQATFAHRYSKPNNSEDTLRRPSAKVFQDTWCDDLVQEEEKGYLFAEVREPMDLLDTNSGITPFSSNSSDNPSPVYSAFEGTRSASEHDRLAEEQYLNATFATRDLTKLAAQDHVQQAHMESNSLESSMQCQWTKDRRVCNNFQSFGQEASQELSQVEVRVVSRTHTKLHCPKPISCVAQDSPLLLDTENVCAPRTKRLARAETSSSELADSIYDLYAKHPPPHYLIYFDQLHDGKSTYPRQPAQAESTTDTSTPVAAPQPQCNDSSRICSTMRRVFSSFADSEFSDAKLAQRSSSIRSHYQNTTSKPILTSGCWKYNSSSSLAMPLPICC